MRFHNVIFVYCVALSCIVENANQSEIQASKLDKPNIIVIVADDLVIITLDKISTIQYY